ncbi:MAG: endopeptidase La [Deltaproteobacteria bacterium]|nr:endopeptidase La [Deltaproteobacteria bacterium]
MSQKTDSDRIADIPRDLPILPLRYTVAYPFSVLTLMVGVPRSVKMVEEIYKDQGLIGLVTSKDGSVDEPRPDQIHNIGTVAKIEQVIQDFTGTLRVVVRGIERFEIEEWIETEPYLKARISPKPDLAETGVEMDAMARSLRGLAQEVIKLSSRFPKEVSLFLDQLQDPRHLVYLISSTAGMDLEKELLLLEKDSIKEKMQVLISYLSHEKEVLTLGKKIQTEAREEMDKAQRDYYLRQQLKAIQKELGEEKKEDSVTDEYKEKLVKAALPEEARKEADRELARMDHMSPQSPEYTVIKTYLDWMLELPWNERSEDQMDIDSAWEILNEDHYDLLEVKERIIEYLAVRKLLKERQNETSEREDVTPGESIGAILCFVGPPGVGKTSLGQSIARSLDRRFTRMSLGGMRDEAEIRGHRRTYIGAMPGRILQAIKRAGTRNPVFMLDEVDKVGNDWRGDPSSALLEVLDPAQNQAFRDHYLDVDFDLSDVIFIATANQLETIPAPLRDRMEVIHLDGYTEYEKIHIAKRYLVPRQVARNGLRKEEVVFTREALQKVVQDYTREAGVRNLERQIGAVCRKVAVEVAAGEESIITVTPELVRTYLKKEQFESECCEIIEVPGIATGLAVTAVGGDILFIEATHMKGKGQLTLTGQLGDVMRESAQIAHSYVRSKARDLGFDPLIFGQTDVHVHVPAGAIPKDGPSAGLALVMAVASLYSARPVRSDVGMTGEVTLRGRVLPVGGIKMKVLAAHRAGLKTVILPKRNEKDLDDLPDEVMNDLKFVLVERIDEALSEALDDWATCIPLAANG